MAGDRRDSSFNVMPMPHVSFLERVAVSGGARIYYIVVVALDLLGKFAA